jgi:hypothetical protein
MAQAPARRVVAAAGSWLAQIPEQDVLPPAVNTAMAITDTIIQTIAKSQAAAVSSPSRCR